MWLEMDSYVTLLYIRVVEERKIIIFCCLFNDFSIICVIWHRIIDLFVNNEFKKDLEENGYILLC